MRTKRVKLEGRLKSIFGNCLILNIFGTDEESIEKIIKKDGTEGLWYREFRKAFPVNTEREKPEEFIQLLKDSKKHLKKNDYVIMSLEDENEIIGGSTINRLTSNDYTVAIFEYTFIDKKYRNLGLGKVFTSEKLDEIKKQAESLESKFVAILAETKNPERTSLTDVQKEDMSIKTRRKILSRWGYKVIDFSYIQPPIYKGCKLAYHLDLLIKPIDEGACNWKEDMPSKDLKKILDMYFNIFKDFNPDSSYYKKMVDYISKKEKILLKPLN
jgi:hypothetical protein